MTVYSPDLRQRIIDAHRDGEGSIRALADRFCVSPATVQSYLKRWRETGSVAPAEYRHGPEPTIPDEHLGRVRRLVEENNDRTLEEYAAMYSKRYGVQIRKSAFATALRRARISRKKKTVLPSEQEPEDRQRERRNFRRKARRRSPRRFLFVDEFGFNRATGRRYGRARRGARVKAHEPENADPNMTLVVALTKDGPVAPYMFEGAMDGPTFVRYVEQSLAPKLQPGDVVVWDGLGAHRTLAARVAVIQRGAEVLPLPGYSPDLTPVEELGSKIKTLARGRPHDTKSQIRAAAKWAYSQVTPEDAHGWWSHRGWYL